VLPTDLATPLAVALAELLTNAVEHAFTNFGGADNEHVGVVTLNLYIEDDQPSPRFATMDRIGENFSLDVPTSLGLSIVRDIIRAQLYGEIEMNSVAGEDGAGRWLRSRYRSACDSSSLTRRVGEPRATACAVCDARLRRAAPDARLLIRGEGELETGLLRVAVVADSLADSIWSSPSRRADREKQLRFGVSTGGE